MTRSRTTSQRDRAWATVRELRRFTLRDVAGRSGVDVTMVQTLVLGWERAGIVQREGWRDSARREDGTFGSGFFVLVRDSGLRAPRVNRHGAPITRGTTSEDVWLAARGLEAFNYRELVDFVSVGDAPASVSTVRTLLKDWKRAGLLVEVSASAPGVPARYRMKPGVGPKPPVVLRTKTIVDGNTGEVLWRRTLGAADAPRDQVPPEVRPGKRRAHGAVGEARQPAEQAGKYDTVTYLPGRPEAAALGLAPQVNTFDAERRLAVWEVAERLQALGVSLDREALVRDLQRDFARYFYTGEGLPEWCLETVAEGYRRRLDVSTGASTLQQEQKA
jgi:hypothetical protein